MPACSGTTEPPPPPPTPGSITLSASSTSPIVAGGTLQLSATVRDTNGQPMPSASVSYSTDAPAIASVSPSGQVTSLGPTGTARITASAGAVTAGIDVTVAAGVEASVTRTSPDVSGVSAGNAAGDSIRVVVKDSFGNARPGATVVFAVTAGGGRVSPETVQTDANGVAATLFTTGAVAGTNTVTATVGALAPAVFSTLTVTPSGLAITAISPSLLTPGIAVTITGLGFSSVPPENALTIDGVSAQVTSASPTQVTGVVPTTLPCTPTHIARIVVTVGGNSAIGERSIRAGVQRTLDVGASAVLSAAGEISCTELPPGNGRYVISVVSTSPSPAAFAPFRLRGAATSPVAATQLVGSPYLRPHATLGMRNGPRSSEEQLAYDRDAIHARVLEQNRKLYPSMRARLFDLRSKSLAGDRIARSFATTPVAVGDLRKFRVQQFSLALNAPPTCASFVEVTAKVVYVGTRGIMYEDVVAPLAGTMDSYYEQLGREFDTSMYASDSAFFADPLLTDAFTDNDQHLNMIFTPSITSGLAGFVTSCDFFPRDSTRFQTSNLGENFYAFVPSATGTGFSTNTPDSWLRLIRATVVHEVKHIASFGAHLVNNASSFEESWLEEGMAFQAEEVWSRAAIYNAPWKTNITYGASLFCDVRPSFPQCSGRPFVMFDHFATLYTFLDNTLPYSPFGRVSDGDFNFYASAWSLLRWAIDRHAGSEAGFLRAITQSVGPTGLANIMAQTGRPVDEMLGAWSLSLYLDENGATAVNADLNFPTWNLRSIYSGIQSDFPSNFPKSYPLVPQPVSGDFALDNPGVHGGSFAMYELSGSAPLGQTIGIIGSGGSGTAAAALRIAIARIQ